MGIYRRVVIVAAFFCLIPFAGKASDQSEAKRIILVAGETAKVDVIGHHDYLAGCAALEALLHQTKGVETVRVNDGWPADEHVFDNAAAVVFYTDGGGKQAFLSSPSRVAKMQSLVDKGVGLVLIHQAVDFPNEFAKQGIAWLGGAYLTGKSDRGHWPSRHTEFPNHPITRGVTAWEINDGWLNGIQFVEGMPGIVPLVWSSKDYEEIRVGLEKHVVSWAYSRPLGGRSFSFSGLDAHSAWELDGIRQLMVNGVLWTAGIDIPAQGAPCVIDKKELQAMQTPRTPRTPKPPATPAKKAP